MMEEKKICPHSKKCGGCSYQGVPYEDQLRKKGRYVRSLVGDLCRVHPVVGMEMPYEYRNKVHAAFARKKDGRIVSGIYEEGSHRVVPIEVCQIEDLKADRIIATIRRLVPSFKIRVYNEDTGCGLLRHVLVRTGRTSGQILVVLVVTSPIFPSKNNFVKALRKEHPEITSVVLNINDRQTSMVLGGRNISLFGRGYINDSLCGMTFRISPTSFYQVNPLQTERLYRKAIDLADLKKGDRVLDTYCGIGTIGICAAPGVKEVKGIELNQDAVRDARANVRSNGLGNVEILQGDATDYMVKAASRGEVFDLIFMDPPRSGSTEAFIEAAVRMKPRKIVYISCNPETLVRDLRLFSKLKYRTDEVFPFDQFPFTSHIEAVCCLSGRGRAD